MMNVYSIMLATQLSQQWECYNCKKKIEGGMCETCGCTFTEYLLSKNVKLSDIGCRLR